MNQRNNSRRPVDLQPGMQIGGWLLKRPLGRGGNGEVWLAKRPDSPISALKILKTVDPTSEPYHRFQTEVRFLQQHTQHAGVLPVLGAYCPDILAPFERAWLAMPVATPMTTKLGPNPSLTAVVEAIAAVAETLADLGFPHRDIKPSNLYWYGDRWVVGDFGLVSLPGRSGRTQSHGKMGPAFFMPNEMLLNPKEADGAKADVYALGKTLWALAAGYEYPIQGEQHQEILGLRLSTYISSDDPAHGYARRLDWLLEAVTRNDPTERLSMTEVVRQLRSWLQLVGSSPPSPDIDVPGLRFRLESVLAPQRRAVQRQEAQVESLTRFMRQFVERNEALGEALMTVDADPTAGSVGQFRPADMRSENFLIPGRRQTASASVRWEYRGQTPQTAPLRLRAELGAAVYDNATIRMAVGYTIHGGNKQDEDVLWGDHREVPLGSPEEETAMRQLSSDLQQHLDRIFDEFLARIPQPNG